MSGTPLVHVHPLDNREDFSCKAAERSHNADVSGSCVGKDVGIAEGTAEGSDEGCPEG